MNNVVLELSPRGAVRVLTALLTPDGEIPAGVRGYLAGMDESGVITLTPIAGQNSIGIGRLGRPRVSDPLAHVKCHVLELLSRNSPRTLGDLRRSVSYRLRPVFTRAIEDLIEDGRIRKIDVSGSRGDWVAVKVDDDAVSCSAQ